MAKNKVELEIPSSLDEITLSQYQRYMKVVDKNESEQATDFVNKKLIEIFCNIPLNEVDQIAFHEYEKILVVLKEAFDQKPEHKRIFKFYDVDMGFLPKLDEITLGEFIDVEGNIGDWQNIHKAMAVLYRPVNFRKNESYTIAPYTPKEDFQEMMKDMPLSVVMGAMVFFYDLGMELSVATLNYMDKLAKDKNNIQLKRLLEQNGDGLAQFTNLAKGISSDLIKLQLNPFSNV